MRPALLPLVNFYQNVLWFVEVLHSWQCTSTAEVVFFFVSFVGLFSLGLYVVRQGSLEYWVELLQCVHIIKGLACTILVYVIVSG